MDGLTATSNHAVGNARRSANNRMWGPVAGMRTTLPPRVPSRANVSAATARLSCPFPHIFSSLWHLQRL
jgi:hypothetical protein